MLVVATRRIAQVVVTVVAEGHINYTALAEMLHTLGVKAYGIAILNAEH